MRCVYCKEPSDGSRSVEHVVPESLGNHTMILAPGVVCDSCNNYFARKVEGPFLNSPALRMLRHEQSVESKRGRVPTVRAFAPGLGQATMHAATAGRPAVIQFDSPRDAHRWLLGDRNGRLLTDVPITTPPPELTSRFLAKLSIGCLADRFEAVDGGVGYLVDHPELDRIRSHGRRGTDRRWPVSVRQIYPADARWNEDGDVFQKVWELDVFDDGGFLYIVFVLFGVEFAIHLGEPDISGYRQWLLENAGRSPLYSGKYAAESSTRDGLFDRSGRRGVVGY